MEKWTSERFSQDTQGLQCNLNLGLEQWPVASKRFSLLGSLESSPGSEPRTQLGMGLVMQEAGGRVFLPDLPLPPRRSFSELYRLSLQEPSRRGAPEPVQDEAPGMALMPTTKQLLHVCLNDGSGPPGPGDLAEERTEFLHSQSSPSPCRCTRSAVLPSSPVSPGGRVSDSKGHGVRLPLLSCPCFPQLPVR